MEAIPEEGRNPAIRERIYGFGPSSLSEEELVALLLGHGHKGTPVVTLARRILSESGGLEGLLSLEATELDRLQGLGPARATRLLAAFEVGRRIWRPRLKVGQILRNPRDAARHFDGLMRDSKQEEFHILLLDTRHGLLGHRQVSMGSLQSSIVHPREVFRPAIRTAAAAIVVGHNHPSGDPGPSPEDRTVTDRLKEAGLLVGIQVLDHLILGEEEFYSFAEDRNLRIERDY